MHKHAVDHGTPSARVRAGAQVNPCYSGFSSFLKNSHRCFVHLLMTTINISNNAPTGQMEGSAGAYSFMHGRSRITIGPRIPQRRDGARRVFTDQADTAGGGDSSTKLSQDLARTSERTEHKLDRPCVRFTGCHRYRHRHRNHHRYGRQPPRRRWRNSVCCTVLQLAPRQPTFCLRL